jgi:hypothetical protein
MPSILTEIFRGFHQSLRVIAMTVHRVGQDRFSSNSNSYLADFRIIRRHVASVTDSVVKRTANKETDINGGINGLGYPLHDPPP